MDYFPLFLRLKDTPCLVVGGGEVALRKVKLLRKAGAQITVIAPTIHPDLAALETTSDIVTQVSNFNPVEARGFKLIVAATDDPLINRSIAIAANKVGVFCNVVDDRELSTAIMPAIVDRSPLVIAVSSGGESPVLATRIRQQLERLFPPTLADLTSFAGEWRIAVKNRFKTIAQRRRFWQTVLDGPVARHVMAGNPAEAKKSIQAALAEAPMEEGFAWIVGAGPGDPELLTLKAARALASADVILHDRLVAPAILDMARKDAEYISVGKQAGKPSISQHEINTLLVEHVSAGKTVCRLKGGDPFIFGRGGEEIEALNAAGLPWQVIPGITAASGCAAAAGVPLTHRNIARSVTIITAFTADESEPDWQSLRHAEQTLVFYMVVNKLEHICTSLIAAGKPGDCPALIIENGTTERQRMINGTLATMPINARDAQVESPAVLMVGPVTELANIVTDEDMTSFSNEIWSAAAKLGQQ
jgi:uroporphyrin-III C-methyltransferase/precorrin-2 dehydrogenase/sirohydrochlorin ferrochelatase